MTPQPQRSTAAIRRTTTKGATSHSETPDQQEKDRPRETAGHSPPIRAAVVGTGGISKEHLGFLAGRASAGPVEGRIRLVGVCDLSEVAATYAARQYEADAAFTELDSLLDSAMPHVVHVLTPPATHVPLVTKCLESGADVICEKPITSTAAELRQLLAVADRTGRRLMESHNYRFNRTIRAIAQSIADGRFGTIREVEIRIALPVTDPDGRFGDPNLPNPIHDMPAGVLHDFTTHFGYLVLHLIGPARFDRIGAAFSSHQDHPLFAYDNLDAILIGRRIIADKPTGPPVHARLRFDAGAAPDTFTVCVRGDRGWTETDIFQPYVREVIPRPVGSQLSPIVNHVVNGAGLVRDGVRNVGRKLLQDNPYEGLHHMLDKTYAALADGSPLPVSPDDMIATSELVDQLLDERHRL